MHIRHLVLASVSCLALTPIVIAADHLGLIVEPCCNNKAVKERLDTSHIAKRSWARHNNNVVRKPADNVERPDILAAKEGDETLSNEDRLADLMMHAADISLRFNAKVAERALGKMSHVDKQGVLHILPYSNYPSFIRDYSVVLVDQNGRPVKGTTAFSQGVSETKDKAFAFDLSQLVAEGLPHAGYRIRAYGNNDVFDETEIFAFPEATDDPKKQSSYTGYGINHLEKSRIEVSGGTITVEGSGVKPNSMVEVLGSHIPADARGNFAAELVVPNGRTVVEIRYADKTDKERYYVRPVTIKENDVFFFAVGDLTYGQNDFAGPLSVQSANPDEFEEEYLHGRAAFYLKGKVLGKYLLTAMADTGEGKLDDIFKEFDEKDPRALIRRIDADRYYPVYGDDSSIEETAPTQGKMYAKIARGTSYAMWGSFETGILHDDFSHINRSLYGAKLHYEAKDTTAYGEAQTVVTGFVADPGTFATRDEFRGTGGSVYFLNYQDITVGSEKVRMEIRDRHSGIVRYVRDLVYGQDYDVDYLQGRILLHEVLPSTASDGDVISTSGAEYGDPIIMVVDYETTPVGTSIDDNHIAGGSAQTWLNDHVLVGATASHENVKGGINNTLYSANATLRHTPQTYIKGSYTISEGNSGELRQSIDGGYNNAAQAVVSGADEAKGYLFEAAVDFSDLNGAMAGNATAYMRHREAGFAAQGYATATDIDQYGGAVLLGKEKGFSATLEADIIESGNTHKAERYLGELGYTADHAFGKVGLGLEKDNSGKELTNIGGRVGVSFNAGNSAYVFGQYTIDSKGNISDNHRVGVGGNIHVTDNVALGGEVAINQENDMTARVSLDYEYDAHSDYYLAYDLSSDKNNFGSGFDGLIGNTTSTSGALVVGGRKRYGSNLSVYGEEKLHHGNGNDGLTHTYGVDFTPWSDVTVGANIEVGEVNNIKRDAYSATIGYGTQDTHISLAGEYRKEEDAGNFEREVYVARANLRNEINDEFTLIGRGNLAFSDNNSTIDEGEFAEAAIGVAYRPKDNDRLNLLGKYTYHYDLATQPQIDSETAADYRQKVHIASIDATLDVTDHLTLGGKYGYKKGEVDFGSGWIDTSTHLGVLRADVHVVHNWDAMLEGRMLHQEESDTTRLGALAGLYRHMNDKIKLGGGYSWSEFDDDITNVNLNNEGWFVNLHSKF